MSDKTKIEWSDATWNPVTGCTKVSEGCRNCYAMTFAERWRGTPGHYFEHGFDITIRPDKLDQPLKWKRSRRIFVNSMSDLFHAEVPYNFICKVYAVMSLAPQHTFQILTKRPDRMLEILGHENTLADIHYFRDELLDDELSFASGPFQRWGQAEFHSGAMVETLFGYEPGIEQWPLPNVWIGVSVENQKAADERIPLLLQSPASIRFLSCEPLLGPVDLRRVAHGFLDFDVLNGSFGGPDDPSQWKGSEKIDWVIAGGESGHGARPMHPEWARSLRDQCQAAGVPFLFKQWGEWISFHEASHSQCLSPKVEQSAKWYTFEDGTSTLRAGKHNTGRDLDGRTWDEYPEVSHETAKTV